MEEGMLILGIIALTIIFFIVKPFIEYYWKFKKEGVEVGVAEFGIKMVTGLCLVGIFVVAPILSMLNCSGWNEGSMQVKSCMVDTGLFREIANWVYGIMLMSAFTLGIPIILYVIFINAILKFNFGHRQGESKFLRYSLFGPIGLFLSKKK